VVHFFHNVAGVPAVSKEVLSRRTGDYQNWVEIFAITAFRLNGPRRACARKLFDVGGLLRCDNPRLPRMVIYDEAMQMNNATPFLQLTWGPIGRQSLALISRRMRSRMWSSSAVGSGISCARLATACSKLDRATMPTAALSAPDRQPLDMMLFHQTDKLLQGRLLGDRNRVGKWRGYLIIGCDECIDVLLQLLDRGE
jgi:hypothetical protein